MEEQLIDYWRSAGKEISILPEDEKEKMWDAIRKKYLRPGVHIGYSICDALNCPLASSMGGADSWRCIGDFMKENIVILFFNKDWGGEFYEIENGRMFVP